MFPMNPFVSTVSPTSKGFLKAMKTPEMKFAVRSWKAKPKASPTIPAPASKEETALSNWRMSKAIKIPRKIKTS